MTTVFIAGSISISHLHEKVKERISNIISSDFNIVVGDADGVDTSVQECLRDFGASHVTVYCTGDKPRNNVAEWPICRVRSKARAGSRAFFTAKDIEMARNSDFGLMIWDCKSTGTLSNVLELLKEGKKSVVFVNKSQDFVTVGEKAHLDNLLRFMTSHARTKAEEKISLSSKIAELAQGQLQLQIATEKRSLSPEMTDNIPVTTVESEAEAYSESIKLRTLLISALSDYIYRAHLNQSQAAKILGVTQPRISDLTRGKVDLFGLDALVNMASLAGLRVEMQVHEASHP